MQPASRQNAFLVAALAIFFWWAFQFAKHDPLLRNINPFGDDPYDAVSSFGAITAVLLALVALVRSFFPQWMGLSGEQIYILRVQAAVPFCILVTVAAEIVAMARHLSMWVGRHGSARLLILETSLAALAAVVLLRIRGKMFGGPPLFARAAAIWLATLFTLGFYPEQVIRATPAHLCTVVLGDVFLFAPVAALVEAWLPDTSPVAKLNVARSKGRRQYFAFAVAVAVGLMIGALAYLAEVGEDTVRPAANQIIFVGSVFAGLGVSGMAIGYAFLGRLLGFAVSDQRSIDPEQLI